MTKIEHKREETIGTGHILITSCSCGWTTQVPSWHANKRQELTAAFKTHKAEQEQSDA